MTQPSSQADLRKYSDHLGHREADSAQAPFGWIKSDVQLAAAVRRCQRDRDDKLCSGAIHGINRDHQEGASTALLAAYDRIGIGHIDLAAFD